MTIGKVLGAGLLSVSLLFAAGIACARYVAPVPGIADYVQVGCNDTITQELIVQDAIEKGYTLPTDTCTNEEMALQVEDGGALLALAIAILGFIYLGLTIAAAAGRRMEREGGKREPATA